MLDFPSFSVKKSQFGLKIHAFFDRFFDSQFTQKEEYPLPLAPNTAILSNRISLSRTCFIALNQNADNVSNGLLPKKGRVGYPFSLNLYK
jgi:hypothetical protein